MKVLVVIDGNQMPVDAKAFEISYNKYEEYDTVIVIDSNSVDNEVEGSVDVRRPSVAGFQSADNMNTEGTNAPISGFYQNNGDNPIWKERSLQHVKVTTENQPSNIKLVPMSRNLLVQTDSFGNTHADILKTIDNELAIACKQLVEREKTAVGDHYIVIKEEPILKIDEKTHQYRIVETIDIVQWESLENAPNAQPSQTAQES